MNKDSILESIKKQLGISEEDTVFDPELIIHINSVLANLTQIGVGPEEGFAITDETSIWQDFIGDSKTLQNVKTYVYLKVRIVFDPPTSSIVMDALKAEIKELEFRMFVETDNEKRLVEQESKSKLTKYSDFLYRLDYKKLNYAFGRKYIEEKFKPSVAGCTSVRNGNMIGRNLDWYYTWQADVVIKVEHTEDHFKSTGVVSAVSEITKTFMESEAYLSVEEALPFLIVDGMNEKGVFVSTHVVHLEKGKTFGTIPTIEERETLCMSMLPRYVLDKFATADEAIDYLRKYVSIYGNKKLWEMGMEAHYLIADKTKTYVIEFVNNQMNVLPYNYLTNFYLVDTVLNQNGKVYTPETQDSTHNAMITNHITELGMGLERWNLIVDEYHKAGTDHGMTELMKDKLNYNRSYTNSTNKWFTEFTGENSQGYLTVKSSVEEYDYIMRAASERFKYRSRDMGLNSVWHTTHTSIYDIGNMLLTLYDSSEDGKAYLFGI